MLIHKQMLQCYEIFYLMGILIHTQYHINNIHPYKLNNVMVHLHYMYYIQMHIINNYYLLFQHMYHLYRYHYIINHRNNNHSDISIHMYYYIDKIMEDMILNIFNLMNLQMVLLQDMKYHNFYQLKNYLQHNLCNFQSQVINLYHHMFYNHLHMEHICYQLVIFIYH